MFFFLNLENNKFFVCKVKRQTSTFGSLFHVLKILSKMGNTGLLAYLIGGSIGVLGVHLLDNYGNERLIGAILGALIVYAVVTGMLS